MRSCFDLRGFGVEFHSGEPGLAAWIGDDFSCFPAPAGDCDLKVSAVRAQPDRAALPPALVRTGRWRILAAPPGRRVVWYPEGAVCRLDYAAGTAAVESPDAELLKELSYLVILSRAGEALDARGLHRVHAGAVSHSGRALLFCGSQGAGKSTLLLELLKDPAFALISDDTPLVSVSGLVNPFPVRMGIGADSPHLPRFPRARRFNRRHYPPKFLLPPGEAGRTETASLPPRAVFLLRRGGRPVFRRAGAAAAAAELAGSLAAGVGVPQMAEYFLRPSPADALRKAGIAASRLRACAALFAGASFWTFETGPDPAANAAALRYFLRKGSAQDARA